MGDEGISSIDTESRGQALDPSLGQRSCPRDSCSRDYSLGLHDSATVAVLELLS